MEHSELNRSIVLYKQAEAWQLPSSSPACTAVEAYLRFAAVPYHTVVSSVTSRSPTGQTPCLEKDLWVASLDDSETGSRTQGHSEASSSSGPLAEYPAARGCIAFAQRHIKDLDEHLSAAQRAELLAYSVLVQSRLEAATLVSTWCEPLGFAEIRKTAAKVPFPLNHILPWSQRREVQARYGRLNAGEVYSEALTAMTALADRLQSSGGRFFFGSQPCSLDAMLAGHLIHYRRSPAIAPVLQNKVANSSVLADYMDHIMKEYFGASAFPTASPGPTEESEWVWSSSWSEAAKGQKAPEPKSDPTPSQKQFKRNGHYWLLGVGAALLVYVVCSGRYVKVEGLLQNLAADDEDEDDEDSDA